MSKLYTLNHLQIAFDAAWNEAWAAAQLGEQEQITYSQTDYRQTYFERVIRDLGLDQSRPRVPQIKKGRFRT